MAWKYKRGMLYSSYSLFTEGVKAFFFFFKLLSRTFRLMVVNMFLKEEKEKNR